MKLAIIGNGFDLHHGLRCSFDDFRMHLINSDNQLDLDLVNDIDVMMNWVYENVSYIDRDKEISWNEFENIIEKYYKFEVSPKNSNNLEESFTDVIADFTEKFNKYLAVEENNNPIKINERLLDQLYDVDVAIVFNYTNCFSSYFSKNTEIFQIHGELKKANLIIGYHDGASSKQISRDYSLDLKDMYSSKFFHKETLGMIYSGRDFEEEINEFIETYSNKIESVVSVGYSFGESDAHIFDILEKVLIQQNAGLWMLSEDALNVPSVNFSIANYNHEITKEIINVIKFNLNKQSRKFEIQIYGTQYKKRRKEIISFKSFDY